MHASNQARMLTVAPGGWDRCTCRHCRISGDDRKRRSARKIERRMLDREIAEALLPEPPAPADELLIFDDDGFFLDFRDGVATACVA